MVEYSVVAHAILIGGSMLLLPMISELFKALTSFYDSVYTVLQSAAV
jgi:Flp pilus assembly pilin Flp